MTPDAPSGTRPSPVVLRIKLRYDDLEAMLQRFAGNVGRSGLFLPTKSLQAVGAEVKFELRLADDTPVLVGLGRVKAARAPDPDHPRAAFGMSIELLRVTRESRDVILKMLERRKALGLPEVSIPTAEDIDAARRGDLESGVKPAVPVDRAPVATRESAPVLTAPRRPTGPLAVAKVHEIAPLAAEPPRKRRASLHELIEKASGPVAASPATVPGLDESLDVGAVLARARALAGGSVDAELEQLRDAAAAPFEISVEAASAELARQLGGVAIARERGGSSAPPVAPVARATPAQAEDPEAPEVSPSTEAVPVEAAPEVAEVEAAPEAAEVETAVVETAPVETAPVEAAEVEAADAGPPVSERTEPVEPVELEASAPVVASASAAEDVGAAEDTGEDADEFAEVDRTVIAGIHEIHGAFLDPQAVRTQPGVDPLEHRIEQQLADADAEAEAEELGFAVGSAAAPAPELEDDEEIEEIDEFEILAEADAEDADLLAADGEADAAGTSEGHPAYALAEEPELDPADEFADEYARLPVGAHRSAARASEPDFVSRLELSDHFAPAPARLDDVDDPLVFDEPHAGLDEPLPAGFPPLHPFDSSDVIEIPVARAPGPSAPPPAADGYDLETALEALDVDLDDLAITHAPTQLPGTQPPGTQRSASSGAVRLPRAPSIRPGGPRLDTDIPIDLDGLDDD